MFRWALQTIVFAVLCLAAQGLAEEEYMDKARRIAGYLPVEDSGDGTPRWDPMAEENRTYVGPVRCDVGRWFRASDKRPGKIANAEDMERWVYNMAYTLSEKSKLPLCDGVQPSLVSRWLRVINTSLYGHASLEVNHGKCSLRIEYSPEARVLAAFRNKSLVSNLNREEKRVLETCGWWISENISLGMPNGQKVQKVHDAIIDTSEYKQKEYNTASLILEGKGAYPAYARATQLLLHMLRIDSRLVRGTPQMNHAWNLVELNDEWFHLDTCWDDPISRTPLRTYHYFLLTDVEMDADHDWVEADLYARTPTLNPWHLHVRNHTRRGSLSARSGYVLPREGRNLDAALHNVYARNAGRRVDDATRKKGVDISARKRGSEALTVDEEASSPNKRQAVKDVVNQGSKKLMSGAKGKNAGTRVMRRSRTAKSGKLIDYEDFDQALERYAVELTGPRLMFQCDEELEPWQMREMVGLSCINKYASRFNVIYDDVKKLISVDMEYADHIRYLKAARNERAARKLSPMELKQMVLCQRWAAKIKAFHSNKLAVRRPHSSFPGAIAFANPVVIQEPLAQAIQGSGYLNSLGHAQAVYVVLNLANVPTELVHGRVKLREASWTMSRVSVDEWYHCDAFPDRGGRKILPCFDQSQYCLMCDEDMRQDHVWDAGEFPPTPNKVEREIRAE